MRCDHIRLPLVQADVTEWRDDNLTVVTYLRVGALGLVAMFAVGCGSAGGFMPKPSASPSRSSSSDCTTSAAKGACGPYDSYPPIAGTTSSTYIGQDVWHPIPGWAQTLHATDPGNWYVTATMPAGNTAVVSYPSVSANYGRTDNTPDPLSDFSSIYSSFTENMNATGGTSAEAAYDIWLGQNSIASPSNEVMIQNDIVNRGACPVLATTTFGGSGGVPVQKWNLCHYQSELIWQLVGSGEQSGRVDILSMLTWLENHRYLPQGSGLWQIGYGFELCSTGGANENFQVSSYSITPTPSSSVSLSPPPS